MSWKDKIRKNKEEEDQKFEPPEGFFNIDSFNPIPLTPPPPVQHPLQKKKKRFLWNVIILSFLLFPGLAGLISLAFFYSEIRPYLLWFFDWEELWLFGIGFLAIFEFFMAINLAWYLWKYISTKRKWTEFSMEQGESK